ncbi:hypothetical protein ES705_42992 [subsurface metagenome]
MNKTVKSNERHIKEDDRFLKAKEDFQKMQKEIEPFIKRKTFKQYSTTGQWHETANLYFI